MKINAVSNQNFTAMYQISTKRKPEEIAKIFDKEIAIRDDKIKAARQILQYEIYRKQNIINSKEATLAMIEYMKSPSVKKKIESLPQQDTVTLYTPDSAQPFGKVAFPRLIYRHINRPFDVKYGLYDYNSQLEISAPKQDANKTIVNNWLDEKINLYN